MTVPALEYASYIPSSHIFFNDVEVFSARSAAGKSFPFLCTQKSGAFAAMRLVQTVHLSPIMTAKRPYINDRRHILRIDGNLVVAYNTDKPYPPQIDPQCTPRLRHMHLPIYDRRDVPYLCAAPATPDYSGAILGRLSQTFDHFPLVKVGNRYALEPKLAARWQSLEQALMGIALALLQHSGAPLVPLEYRFPPSPRKQGYLESHDSKHEALMAIQRSRDAFQPLIAHTAWAAILHRGRQFWKLYSSGTNPCKDDDLDRSWADTLEKICKVHLAWVRELRSSAVCDFNIRRAGLVIREPRNWPYTSKLVPLVLSNVPIWIIWGKGPCDRCPPTWTNDLVVDFGPSEEEAAKAQEWYRQPPPPPSFPSNASTKSCEGQTPSLVENSPQSVAESGDDEVTRKHVDIHEWIRTQELMIETLMKTSDQAAITKWKQRQEAAEAQQCPGERGAIVYEWDRDDHQNPIRTRVNRANVEQSWVTFGANQRWFNCVDNEWELCRELDPSDMPEDRAIKHEDNTDDDVLESNTFSQGWTIKDEADVKIDSSALATIASTSEDIAELGRELNPSDEPENKAIKREADTDEDALESNTFLQGWMTKDEVDGKIDSSALATISFKPEDIAVDRRRDLGGNAMDAFHLISNRYGYSYLAGTKYETYPKTPMTLHKALRVIGDEFETSVYTMEVGAEASFIQYIMYLNGFGHPDIDQTEVPSALCDLYPENPSYLGKRTSTVTIERVVYMSTTLYIIRHRNANDSDWLLAVKDPCTALQCMRSCPNSLTELVRELMNSKTAFYTLKPMDGTKPYTRGRAFGESMDFRGNRTGLGTRPPEHILDLTDYIAYEAVKAKLVQDKRIARAAIKRGGIIARLASGLVDEYDVLDGPTWDTDGRYLHITLTSNGEMREYFDDDMSLEELATFVGLYNYYARKLSSLLQTH